MTCCILFNVLCCQKFGTVSVLHHTSLNPTCIVVFLFAPTLSVTCATSLVHYKLSRTGKRELMSFFVLFTFLPLTFIVLCSLSGFQAPPLSSSQSSPPLPNFLASSFRAPYIQFKCFYNTFTDLAFYIFDYISRIFWKWITTIVYKNVWNWSMM